MRLPFLLAFWLLQMPAQAQGWVVFDSDEEADLEAQFEELGWETGTVDLAGVATLTVPPGYRYASPETLIGQQSGLPGVRGTRPVYGEGMLFPVPEPGWKSASSAYEPKAAGSVLITHFAPGHVHDDDEVDPERWLDLREDRAQEKRRRGHRHSRVTRWLQAPQYDARRRLLSWSEEVEPPGEEYVGTHHEVRLLGRESVIRISGHGSAEDAEQILRELRVIADAVRFDPGHRYWEYDWQLDPDAEGGLAELVVGFDTYAAAKGLEPVDPPSGFGLKFWITLAAGFAVIAIAVTHSWFARR